MPSEYTFPDFTKCIEFRELHAMMGIQEVHLQPIPPAFFSRTVTRKVSLVLPGEEIRKRFLKGVECSLEDLKTGADGLLELQGHTCCIYIKYQRNLTYKYHLFECRTIQGMTATGRRTRYVATTRSDGYFPVVRQHDNTYDEVLLPLGLCLNCAEILRSLGWDTPFSLKDFFEKHGNSFNGEYMWEEMAEAKEQYAPNHEETARAYKEQVHYRCQRCGLDCSAHRHLLHLHHNDGDGQNNVHTNLRVLCVRCHAQQMKHEHMKTEHAEDIRQCEELCRIQGIFSV